MVNNTKYGTGALENNTGQNNTGIGAYTGYNNLAGFNNTAVGSNSAFFNTTGDNNTSLGAGSLCNNTIGSLNTAIGSSALEGVSSVGNQNTAVGAQALFSNEGDLNTAIGTYAALGVTGGNYNTFLGANTTASQSNLSYSTAIGYNSIIDASNQIKIGGLNSGIYPNVVIPGLANYITYIPGSYNTNTLVPKQYVDQFVSGLSIKAPVQAISISDISGNYSNVSPGSITGVTIPNPFVVDGVTIIDGSSVLLNGQANPVQNGIYVWNNTTKVLTRRSDMQNGENISSSYVFVKQGVNYAKSAWGQVKPAIVGDSSLNFIEFSSFDYALGRGLQIDNIGGVSTIDVDTSLNFINFLDSSTSSSGGNGTLALGTYTTNAITIGPTGTSVPIQAQSIIQAQKGITGATGSFQKLTCQNGDINLGLGSSGSLTIDGFGVVNITGAPVTTIGTAINLKDSNIIQNTPSSKKNLFYLSEFPSGLTGATGSFNAINSNEIIINDNLNTAILRFVNQTGVNYIETYTPSATNAPLYLTNKFGANTYMSIIPNAGETTANIGINKLNPSKTLDVSGNINFNGNITGPTGSFTNLLVSQQILAPGGITGATGSFTYLNSSNTANLQDLYVNGQHYAPGGLTGGTGAFTYLSSSNNTYLATTNGTRVGIGNTNPASTLDVSGNARFSDVTFIGPTSNPTNTLGILKVELTGANLLVYKDASNNYTSLVNTGGNTIEIGSTSFSNNLVITGTTTSTSFNTSSDYRLKENIENLDDNYSVDNLRPVYYNNKKTKQKDIGLIAHELQEHYPFLVNGEKDGNEFQSVNYNGLIGILIKEIKELKKRVKVLEDKQSCI